MVKYLAKVLDVVSHTKKQVRWDAAENSHESFQGGKERK